MSVFVDPARLPYRGQMYCHVWADSLHELHLAAAAAGLKREWFQEPPKASWRHYDCAPRVRAVLVRNGAIETDMFGPAEHEARRKGNTAALARIAHSRALRAETPAVATDLFAESTAPAPGPDPRIHLCMCGEWGAFGFRGVNGQTEWFCHAHREHADRRAAA
ncbi:DUF4031 domain-containing protein [Lichenihabitans psoromatis]|uniref:DUF4031 domain-containing protein n=1 Tax=Lichenihabitans psoromatis TaxID=2528642 RepID=UPI001036DB6C|nr:DUF4031 domain-containing protein [Lichenihabitans psoromatis]